MSRRKVAAALFLLAMAVVSLNGVFAANNPGHDSLYLEEIGNSTLTGSLNISDRLRVANLLYSAYLDVQGNGSQPGNSRAEVYATSTNALHVNAPGNLYLLSGAGSMVYVGTSNVDLNVSRNAYVTSTLTANTGTFTTLTRGGSNVCTADGTNCPGTTSGANVTSTGSASYLPVFTGASNIGNSVVYQSGSNVGIGTTSADTQLTMTGATAVAMNGVKHYKSVVQYSDGASTVVGTMKVTMPKNWSNTMMQIRILGYDYSGTGPWEVLIGGYNYQPSPGWHNYRAEIRGRAPFNQIRLANDGTYNVILLGNTSTTWSYPKIEVTDFVAGHSDIDAWGGNWAITNITSESGLNGIVSLTLDTFTNSAGNFGIATVNPSSALEVNGNVELTNLYDNDGSTFFDGGACTYGISDISSTGAITCASAQGTGSMSSWTLAGDSGTASITNGVTATIAGGTNGIDTAVSGTTNTLSLDWSEVSDQIGDTQLAYNTGQHLTTSSSPTFAGLTNNGALRLVGNMTVGNDQTTWSLAGAANGGAIQVRAHSAAGGYDDRYLRLGVVDNSGVFTSVIAVTTDQKVGIGTTNPAQKLTVSGGSVIVDNTLWYYGYNNGGSAQPLMRSRGMGYNPTTYPGLQIGQTGDSIALFIDPNSISGGTFNGNTENELVVPNNLTILQANTGSTDWLVGLQLRNGNLGIGVTPSQKLDVAGAIGISGTQIIDGSRNFANIGTISSGAITSTGTSSLGAGSTIGSKNVCLADGTNCPGTSSGANITGSGSANQVAYWMNGTNLGGLSTSGSGSVVLATGPTISGPTLSGTVSGGTFSSGTWNGNSISTTYTDAKDTTADTIADDGTISDSEASDALTITGGTLGSNTIASGAAWSVTNTLNVDSNTLYIDGSNDRVGVGTGSPSQKLSVDGNVKIHGGSEGSGDLLITNAGVATTRNSGNISVLAGLRGRVVNYNPDFSGGTYGYSTYDNSGGGKTGIAVASDATSPSSSGRVLNISYDGTGTPDTNPMPGYGGFYIAVSRCGSGASGGSCYIEGNRYVYRFWAKIPSGRTINWASNGYGNSGSQQWVSSRAGTGNWEQYVTLQKIGEGGSFSSTGFFYISGGSNTAFSWQVANFEMVGIDEPTTIAVANGINIGYKQDVNVGNGNLIATGTTYLATDAGSVGIATINPSSTLEVNGNVELTNLYDNDGSTFFDGGACTYGISDISSTGAISCASQQGTGSMSSWTLAGTSGSSQTISNGDTLTIAAGTGITTTGSATDTVTVAVTADSIGDTQLAYNTGQHLTTADSPQFAGINLGHASDTTITRTGAGALAVEGNTIWTSATDGSGSTLDADYIDGRNTATFWGSDNDGASSTLDADLLDGQHGSYYLDTSSTGQTKSGTIILSTTASESNLYHLELFSADTGNASAPISLRFHQGNQYYHRIRADSSGFSLTQGNTPTLVNLNAATITAGTQFSGAGTGLTGTASSLTAGNSNQLGGQASNYFLNRTGFAAENLTSGTVPSARLSGSYTGITGVGTLTAGSWTASSIGTSYTDAKDTTDDSVSGTVDSGEMTDGAALAEILDDDGSGSTLDADTVDGLHASNFSREYQANIAGVSNAGWTNVAYIDGSGLNSKIRLSMGGTTGSVVVDVVAEILVNHYQDIFIQSASGSYTQVTLLITSDNDDNYYIQAKTDSANAVTLDCRIVTYGGEAVTWSPGAVSGSTTLEHTAQLHQLSISSTGGATVGMKIAGNTVWHAGNDGSSSTLDADLLDGQEGTFFLNRTGFAAENLTSGTVPSVRLSGSYTGITGVGTLTAGSWTASSIGTGYTDAKDTTDDSWSGTTSSSDVSITGGDIAGANGVSIDLGEATVHGLTITDSDVDTYADIACADSGGSDLCEFPTGAYISGSTLYVQNNIVLRGALGNDGAPYLQFNGGTSGYNYFGGSVGIGTNSPAQALTVVGTANVTGATYLGNSKCGTGQFLTTDASTGLISCSTVSSGGSSGGWLNTTTTAWNDLQVIVNSSSSAGSFIVKNTTGNTHLFVNGSSGKVGIGTTTLAARLQVNESYAGTSGSSYGIFSTGEATNAAASSSWVYGAWLYGVGSGANLSGLVGSYSSAKYQGTGTVDSLMGAFNYAKVYSGNATNVYGSLNAIDNGIGSVINNAYAVYATTNTNFGTTNNAYGVYIDQVQGTNKWALYSADTTAKSYFGGNVGIGITVPTANLHVNSSAAAGSLLIQNTTGSTHLFVNGTTGDIGIGTTAPSAKLEILGSYNILRLKSSGGYEQILLYSGTNQGFKGGQIHLAEGNGAAHDTFIGRRDGGGILINSSGAAALVVGNATATHLFVNGSSGHVGIGTTAPAARLDVNGTSYFQSNMTFVAPATNTLTCFERVQGSSWNYSRCMNSSGAVIEQMGNFSL